jgi:hypothetical protein
MLLGSCTYLIARIVLHDPCALDSFDGRDVKEEIKACEQRHKILEKITAGRIGRVLNKLDFNRVSRG